MANGTVDVRTRDNQRLGKMRVDKVHEYFQSLFPKNSNAWEQFYEKAWDPADYEQSCMGHYKEGEKEKCKLFVQGTHNCETLMVQIVGDIVGADVEVV